MTGPQKLNTDLPHDPAISPREIYPQELKAILQTNPCT